MPATYRNEQTGTPSLDRMQSVVRDLVAFVNRIASHLLRAERCYGSGITRINLANIDRTLAEADADFAAGQLVFTGALTADRTVHLPRATDATAYFRWCTNVTSGGFNVVLATPDGSYSLAAGSKGIWVSASGPGAVP